MFAPSLKSFGQFSMADDIKKNCWFFWSCFLPGRTGCTGLLREYLKFVCCHIKVVIFGGIYLWHV